MQLLFVRHGIAHDRMAPDCPPDPQRALTERGIERTRLAALGLRQMNVACQRRYTSPYLRATQTMDLVTEALELDHCPLVTTDTLTPYADAHDVLELLAEEGQPDAILTGHAPHCDDLVTLLVCGPKSTKNDALRQPQVWMKKASAALIEIDDVRRVGSGLLRWLIPPKALRALGRGEGKDSSFPAGSFRSP